MNKKVTLVSTDSSSGRQSKIVPAMKQHKILFGVFLVVILVGITTVGYLVYTFLNAPPYHLEKAFPDLQFNKPLYIVSSHDGTGRLFVVEQEGIIKVMSKESGTYQASIFLNITDRVSTEHFEEGLLGLAFHPNYTENGKFYVYYTTEDPQRNVLAEFEVLPNDPNKANVTSERVLLEIIKPPATETILNKVHNGGQLLFGPDGYLYLGIGDGAIELGNEYNGDPYRNGQNCSTLLGSIIRIDVDHPSDGKPYGIPADNPFVGASGGCREEIYAYGFRNPWRFSFDAVTKKLWVGDVGFNRREEIDIVEKGKNYGWNAVEGTLCYPPNVTDCNKDAYELPIWEYETRVDGLAIIGGYVYRGTELPDLVGKYIYADYLYGKVWALEYDENTGAVSNRLIATMERGFSITSFGVDDQNELFITSFDGFIYKIVPN